MNIVEIKQAEKEYKHAEDTLHRCEQILSITREHMSFIDRNYIYQTVNNAYLRAHQRVYQDIIGHSVPDLLGADLFEQVVKEKLDRCLAGEEIYYQAWFSFPQLGQRYMEVTYYPFFGENNEITGVVVSSHDSTEQKQNEELLRASEIRYHQMFETNAAAKLIIDSADGHIVESNEAACDFYGYDAQTLNSLYIMDINVQPDEETQKQLALLKAEKQKCCNFHHRLASGEIRDVEVYSGPLQNNYKALIYLIIHDVTARKKAEQSLQEIIASQLAAEVIQEKNKEVEETNIALRVLLKQQKDVARNVQQSVLAQLEKTVLPYINLCHQCMSDDKGKEYLDIITDHVHEVGSSFIKKLSNPDLGLTKKEILVADLVKQGRKSKEIAKLLNMQPSSVETYRNRIRKKLNITNKNVMLHQYLDVTFSSNL